ncbi:hypothetical protein [Larkinella sp. GY13]|uniref:hypothetical protein n=1 Tax=Larkinella sp. GY13 TaxID=3453720 RepID=UPI003F701C85
MDNSIRFGSRIPTSDPRPARYLLDTYCTGLTDFTNQLLGFDQHPSLIFGGILPILQITIEMKGCFTKQTYHRYKKLT